MLRPALVVSLVALLAGCKKSDDAATAAKPDRRTRCNAIGDQITQMGMALAQGLTVGLSDGKAKIDAAEEAKLRAELETAKAELVEQCMEWPEEALDCFGIGAIGQSEKCERILAAAMGEPVLPEGVPAGPEPAWTFDAPHPIADMVGRDDGSVVVLLEPKEQQGDDAAFVVAVKDGKQLWSRALSQVPFALEVLSSGEVIAIADHRVFGIGGADGAELWSAEPPTIEEGPSELVAVADATEVATLLDMSGALLRVDPVKCKAGKECIATLTSLELPTSYGTRWLEHGIAGGWLVVAPDDGAIFVLNADGKQAVQLVAHAEVSWARAHGELVRIAMDGAVAVIDPKTCGDQGKPIAPITWPPSKKAKWVSTVTEREIEAAPTPEGCVKWQAELVVAEDADAVDVPGDDLFVQAGGFLFAFDAKGTRKVKTAVSANSLVRPTGGGLAVVGDLGTESVELVLTWLSMDGKHERRSALSFGEERMFLMDDVMLQTAGTTIVAGLETKLVAFAP
jgi:hypothetical protein